MLVLVIEVAIGQYGTDILDKLAESTTKNTYMNGKHHYHITSNEQESQLENGWLYIYINHNNNIHMKYDIGDELMIIVK